MVTAQSFGYLAATERLKLILKLECVAKYCRVTVWSGLWSRSIIRPFLFENEQGVAVPVNGDSCLATLNEFLFTKIEEEHIGSMWFQQDGSTCHPAEAIFEVLRLAFEDRVISCRTDVIWPHWRCVLTLLDYYL